MTASFALPPRPLATRLSSEGGSMTTKKRRQSLRIFRTLRKTEGGEVDRLVGPPGLPA